MTGVSTITVSRAFRHPEKVSEDLRRRIQQAADDIGYVRNRAASALASNRSMNIAVPFWSHHSATLCLSKPSPASKRSSVSTAIRC
jgi:DNA-binding LacI/PurR family transcriptional regulator